MSKLSYNKKIIFVANLSVESATPVIMNCINGYDKKIDIDFETKNLTKGINDIGADIAIFDTYLCGLPRIDFESYLDFLKAFCDRKIIIINCNMRLIYDKIDADCYGWNGVELFSMPKAELEYFLN